MIFLYVFRLKSITAANTKIAAIYFCSVTEVYEFRKAKNVKLAARR
jgi:hypothetical protein